MLLYVINHKLNCAVEDLVTANFKETTTTQNNN